MQHLDPKEIYLKVLDIHIKKLNELSATKQYPILLSRSEQNIFRQALRCIKKTGDFDKIVEVFCHLPAMAIIGANMHFPMLG